MMLELLFIGSLIGLFILLKIGPPDKVEYVEQKQKKVEKKELEKVKNIIPEIVEKKEILYSMNVEPIKLYLYSSDTFNTTIIEKLYIKSMVEMYMISEPFHTNFYKILKFIDTNDFWIKRPESNEIIINMKKNRSKTSVYKALITYDIVEIINLMFKNIMNSSSNINKEFCMLSSIIYALSQSSNLENFCVISGAKYTIEECLIDRFYSGYSDNELYLLLPKNSKYYKYIERVYLKATEFSSIYSTNVKLKGFDKNMKKVVHHVEFPKLVKEVPKKKLMSIS